MSLEMDSSQKMKLIAGGVILVLALGLLVWNFLPEAPPPGAVSGDEAAAAEPSPDEPPPKNRARAPQ